MISYSQNRCKWLKLTCQTSIRSYWHRKQNFFILIEEPKETKRCQKPPKSVPPVFFPESSVFLEERIRANLERLNLQISDHTQVLNQLIHENKAITGRSRVQCQHTGSLPDMEIGATRTSPDRGRKKFCLFLSKMHF